MNFVSFLLPILALFYTIANAQLSGTINKLYNCDVTIIPGILYKYANIRWMQTITGEACIEQCLMNNKCVAINFIADQSACGLHFEGITSPQADPRLYDINPSSTHAYINNCASTKSSGPVGCGKQAIAYGPSINKFMRIIGGKEAKPHSWPWLSSLFIDLRNGGGTRCGASLIRVRENMEKSDVVITAAHCVTKEETMGTIPVAFAPDQFSVVAGDHVLDKYDLGEAQRLGSAVRFHPGFKFTPAEGAINDLALIKLETPIDFTDTIRPICLPGAGETVPVGKTCVAAGWGRNNSQTKDTPENLQQVLAPVQDPNICRRGWGPQFKENMMVCAGSLLGFSGACQGDSGGMLACQQPGGGWTLFGATSYGVAGTCVEAGKPAIFTRLSNYVDWITKNMNEMTSLMDIEDFESTNDRGDKMEIEK